MPPGPDSSKQNQRELPIPAALSDELDRLLGPASGLRTSSELDERVLAEAKRVLAPGQRLRTQLRRAAPLAAAAAIAVAAWTGLTIWMTPAATGPTPGPTITTGPATGATHHDDNPYDIDGSGRVDIIDAFRVARALDRREPVQPEWDVSGDGLVDAADVDQIARAGVALVEPSS